MSASLRTIPTAPDFGAAAITLAGLLVAGALVAGVLAARPVAPPDQLVVPAPNVAPAADHGWSTDPAAGTIVDQVHGGRGTRIAQ